MALGCVNQIVVLQCRAYGPAIRFLAGVQSLADHPGRIGMLTCPGKIRGPTEAEFRARVSAAMPLYWVSQCGTNISLTSPSRRVMSVVSVWVRSSGWPRSYPFSPREDPNFHRSGKCARGWPKAMIPSYIARLERRCPSSRQPGIVLLKSVCSLRWVGPRTTSSR